MSTTLGAYSKFELSAKQKQEIKEAFMACDVEGTGYMSTGDLKVGSNAIAPNFKSLTFLVPFRLRCEP